MRNIYLSLLFVFAFAYSVQSQSYGFLTVQTTTSNAGGNYNPRNVVAIWVEDNSGNFVKTLLAYGNNRKTHLNNWQASTTGAGSAYNTVDAISGATRNSHAIRNCTWNGTDINGALVPDGTYKLKMELTDKNSTGNYSTFTFVKGPNVDLQTPSDEPSFASLSIHWKPSAVNIEEARMENKTNVFPNPTKDQIIIECEQFISVELYNINGRLIYKGDDKVLDVSVFETGLYVLRVITENEVYIEKVIKQ